jgi:uncharacterized Fe-S center protein
LNNKERAHIESVKNLPCGVCGAYPPTDAHHMLENSRRISHYMVIPLCRTCHDQVPNGAMWKIYKKTELNVLSDTIERLKNDTR